MSDIKSYIIIYHLSKALDNLFLNCSFVVMSSSIFIYLLFVWRVKWSAVKVIDGEEVAESVTRRRGLLHLITTPQFGRQPPRPVIMCADAGARRPVCVRKSPPARAPLYKNNCTNNRCHYSKLYTITDHCLHHYTPRRVLKNDERVYFVVGVGIEAIVTIIPFSEPAM